jgi:hypothetical protein
LNRDTDSGFFGSPAAMANLPRFLLILALLAASLRAADAPAPAASPVIVALD